MSGYTSRFEIETNKTSIEVYKLLRNNLSLLEKGDVDPKFGPEAWPIDRSCSVCFYEISDKKTAEWYIDIYNINPLLKITIELSKAASGLTNKGLKNTVEIINFLFNNLEGNAILRNEDYWAINRKNGIIELDPRHSLWKPEHLAMFTFPYKIVELPQP
jgi:hypothetical protein